jgi:hypothetical protein
LTTASLGRLLRDHRTGEVHIPHEPVAILGVKENLGRTLFGVKRQAGGESVLLADNLAGLPRAETADTGSLSSLQVEMGRTNQRFGPGWSEKTAMASEPYSLPRIPQTTTSDDRRTPRRGPSPHNGGENVHHPGPSATLPATSSERGLLQSAHRQCLHYDSPVSDFGIAIETDVAPVNGHLVTPVDVESLTVTKRRRTAKPARIASQQSRGQEPEAFLAALSLGALFALILTSVVMKLFIG